MEEFGWFTGKTNAAGCTGGDNITSFEGHAGGEQGDGLRDRVDHLAGIAILLDDSVDFQAYGQSLWVGYFVGGDNPWSHGAIAVEAFAAEILFMAELDVTGRHIVKHGIAEDMGEGILFTDIFAALPMMTASSASQSICSETAGSMTISLYGPLTVVGALVKTAGGSVATVAIPRAALDS